MPYRDARRQRCHLEERGETRLGMSEVSLSAACPVVWPRKQAAVVLRSPLLTHQKGTSQVAVGLLFVILAVLGLLSVAALAGLIVWLVRRTEGPPANAD